MPVLLDALGDVGGILAGQVGADTSRVELPQPAASTWTVSSRRDRVPDRPSSVTNSFSWGSRARTDSISLLLLSNDTVSVCGRLSHSGSSCWSRSVRV